MDEKIKYKKGWSLETIYEIIGDLICFEFILKIKTLIKDIEVKTYLSQFLKILAPIYAYEIANSLQKFGIMNKNDFFNPGMSQKIHDERQRAIKCIIVKSSRKEEIAQDMGLDFNNKVYDMNIIIGNNKLFGMNYEDYMDRVDEENFDFWESLFDFPRRTLDAFILSLNFDINLDNVFENISEQLEQIALDVENKLHCSRYSYSSYTLFSKSKSLDIIDKIFILYRYRMISSVTNIEHVLPSFSIDLGNNCVICLKKFFRKYKAIIIEIVGKELKNMDTEFCNNIKRSLESDIQNDNFWKLNRIIRNNLHYGKTITLKNEELAIVDHYQTVYLNIISEHMVDNLNIQIDKECKRMTEFLNACQQKGLTKSDIDKYYYYYYVKFKLTGKI